MFPDVTRIFSRENHEKNYPDNTEALLKWTWAEIAPYYQDLQTFDLNSDNVDAWLKGWSDLTRHVFEIQTRLSVRTTVNTADEEGEKLYAHFLDTIFPKSQEAENALNQEGCVCIFDTDVNPFHFHR